MIDITDDQRAARELFDQFAKEAAASADPNLISKVQSELSRRKVMIPVAEVGSSQPSLAHDGKQDIPLLANATPRLASSLIYTSIFTGSVTYPTDMVGGVATTIDPISSHKVEQLVSALQRVVSGRPCPEYELRVGDIESQELVDPVPELVKLFANDPTMPLDGTQGRTPLLSLLPYTKSSTQPSGGKIVLSMAQDPTSLHPGDPATLPVGQYNVHLPRVVIGRVASAGIWLVPSAKVDKPYLTSWNGLVGCVPLGTNPGDNKGVIAFDAFFIPVPDLADQIWSRIDAPVFVVPVTQDISQIGRLDVLDQLKLQSNLIQVYRPFFYGGKDPFATQTESGSDPEQSNACGIPCQNLVEATEIARLLKPLVAHVSFLNDLGIAVRQHNLTAQTVVNSIVPHESVQIGVQPKGGTDLPAAEAVSTATLSVERRKEVASKLCALLWPKHRGS